ncbi:T9SS type A sorting domain-containing protein [Psychroserpens damuponensis]|uniref:T9SS type A sorting domain-containing protein n=2 Tax=Psychroserpens TaxID=49277 RepID=UPI00058E3773|nr:T9SS type A sorting domain-containing protein [Psychroserpens damuponensis]
MKIKLLTLILLGLTQILNAQITTSEAYIPGTKLVFYANECGNTLPEAAGKLTFCDGYGNLGVVEESYGLNNRNIRFMLENRANADEAFVTNDGLSIKLTDGSYENVPNIAIPDFTTAGDWQNDNIFRSALIMPNNNVIFSGGDYYLYTYNRTQKTITTIEFPNFHSPVTITYDEDRDLAWIIARQGTNAHLYRYTDDNGLVYESALSSTINVSQLSSGALNSPTFTYREDYLYFGIQSGLFKVSVLDYTTTIYNSTTTPSLPSDNVNDLKFDNNGDLWLALTETNDGSILKFNIVNETFEQYELPRVTNPAYTYKFSNIALDNAGTIWCTALDYSGLIKLEFDQDVPQWEQIPLTDLPQLGVESPYVPDNIFYKNDKFYFTTFSASSGSSSVDQILIYDNGNWSSITDTETDNISHLSSQRFNYNLPDDNGGMWWFNWFDDVIVHRKANDEQFVFTNVPNLGSYATIDTDDKPIIPLNNSGTKVTKIDTPLFYGLSNDTNQNINGLVRHKDEIWWYNESTLQIKILKYNQVIATFDLDNSYDNAYYFQVDSNGDAWFSKNESNGTIIKKFETSTSTTIDYLFTENFGQSQITVAAPNGAMWFVRTSGLIYYDGTTFTTYPAVDHPELYNMQSLIVDSNNVAHVLLNDNAAIVKIENAGTSNVSFSTTFLEGINSILPALGHYRPDDLSIDSQGAMWTHASQNTFKLIDADMATEYRTEGETYNVSGLIYNDLNENNVFDTGEEYAGQLVALKLNGNIYSTFTNANGVYAFYIYDENSTYEITLPTIGQFVTAANRQLEVAVGSNNQDYDGNDFQLKPKFVNSLLVKSSSKLGAWGFVRANFENTYTTAIGNLSTTKTFNNLEVTYTFKNQDENSTNILPSIDDVKVYELDPNGGFQLIDKVTIDQRNNKWSIDLPLGTYTQNELTITPDIIETGSQTDIKITIPTVSPLNTYIIEIDTGLFDPSETGIIINHGVSSVDSDNFEDTNSNPLFDPIILFPLEDRDDNLSGFDVDDSPYLNPNDVYIDPPYTEPKQIYGPGPYAAKIYSSYDPNDKLVDEGAPGVINDRHIERKWLTYTIRFENSGNFSAKDVVVSDVLDENLDPHSVKVIESSHNHNVDIIKNGNNENILKFSFNNIFLPFDDANNDGYIKFKIKALEGIAENTIVNNDASIYFDQNPAIITNSIQTRFITIESLSISNPSIDSQFKMFPNPTNTLVHIESVHSILNTEIFTILGEKVKTSQQNTIDVSQLNSGTYILKVSSEIGTFTKKLIIN